MTDWEINQSAGLWAGLVSRISQSLNMEANTPLKGRLHCRTATLHTVLLHVATAGRPQY